MSDIKKKTQYAYQPARTLLKSRGDYHAEKYTELGTQPPIIYNSLGDCRANISPVIEDDYLMYSFLQIDTTKQGENDVTKNISPNAINGIVFNITNIHTGKNDLITMPIDTKSNVAALESMKAVIQQYKHNGGTLESGELPDGIKITTIRESDRFAPMFAEYLRQELGVTQNNETFMRHFALELYQAENPSLHGRIIEASVATAPYYTQTTNVHSAVNAAQKTMETALAKKSWSTQVAWQLSELPGNLAATMRERTIGESALLREQGYSPDQANTLAFLKVVNAECHAAKRDGDVDCREQLSALKKRAATLAVDAGCSKEAMITMTRNTIDTEWSEFPEVNLHAMHVAIGDAFNQAVISSNYIAYLATRNKLHHISHTMYDDNTQHEANAKDDLQARIDKNASQLRQILTSSNTSPVIPTAADVINVLESQLANNPSNWVAYMSQYAIEMPSEMHESFLKHCKDALDELNAFTDGTTRAAMSKAAYTALQEIMEDKSLPENTQQTLNNLSTKAFEQAVAAGADMGDVGENTDLSQDSLEEIGDD